MNYKNKELPILIFFNKKAISRRNMTAFRILSILKCIYVYVFLSMHVAYFSRAKTLEYLSCSNEVPLTPRKIKVAVCYMHRDSYPRVKTRQFKVASECAVDL